MCYHDKAPYIIEFPESVLRFGAIMTLTLGIGLTVKFYTKKIFAHLPLSLFENHKDRLENANNLSIIATGMFVLIMLKI